MLNAVDMQQQRILLTGNTCFKIANFREGLVKTLIGFGYEVVVLAPTDATREKLVTMGCRVVDLPMERNGTSLLEEAALLLRMYRSLRSERPEMVFGYTIKNNIYAGLVCRLLNIPFVPNVTGLGPAFNTTGLLNKTIRLMYRLAFARALKVFFQNPNDLDVFLRAEIVLEERTLLLPGSGVNLDKFSFTTAPIDDNRKVFLFVSRLLWDKGLGLFVEAARQMRKTDPTLQFNVLGPVDNASSSSLPIEKINAWVDEGVIDYLGVASDVRQAMTEAHCIVLPTWYLEGTPRVLLEAAAMGRPVITTNTPGCKDAVIDGKTGYLCEAQSLDSLIEALKRFLAMNHHEREAMAVCARMHAESEFDETHIINAYLNVLPLNDEL